MDAPYRIALLVRQFSPAVGGLENAVAALAHELQKGGHSCEIFTLDRLFTGKEKLAPRDVVQGIPVTRWPFIGGRRYFIPALPARTLGAFDVVHVHGIDGMFEAAARRHRPQSQALLATTHGLFFHTPWMQRAKRLYLATVTAAHARRYDAIMANSSADAELMAPHAPLVQMVPNGVAPLSNRTASGRDLLCLGRLTAHKQVPLLIDALAQLRSSSTHLHIVGPEADISADHLRARAAALGLGERVVVHGCLSRAELARLAEQCACFVSASAYEGFGMSMVEAMGAGLIPVVQPNDSFRELIGAAGTGILTDFANPVVAARAIESGQAQATPNARARSIAFALRFSWKAHAQQVEHIYAQALAARRRSYAAVGVK